jgi:hypothetical protein
MSKVHSPSQLPNEFDKASSYLDRALLPSPKAFCSSEFRKLKQSNGSGWTRVLCPFHPDHHPSLSLNLRSGRFYCFASTQTSSHIRAAARLRGAEAYHARSAAAAANKLAKELQAAALARRAARWATLARHAQPLSPAFHRFAREAEVQL